MDTLTLQTILSDLDYKLILDGVAGPATAKALTNFQAARGLTPDGIAGVKTKKALAESAPYGKLAAIVPLDLIQAVEQTFKQYRINSVDSQAQFLAQVGHESAGFTQFEENLNYSFHALRKTFRRYFSDHAAETYANKPEKIANRVYANRMGNGDLDSGDGWRYRGRGAMQLTGKNNYEQYGSAIGDKTIVKDPSQVTKAPHNILSAGWYWDAHGLNYYPTNTRKVTKLINGGLNGLEDREKRFEEYKELLA